TADTDASRPVDVTPAPPSVGSHPRRRAIGRGVSRRCTPPGAALPAGVGAVVDLRGAGRLPSAVRTAEEPAADLGPVADDLAAAVLADRCHPVDGALEAVEHVPLAGRDDLEGLVVLVPAHLTSRHGR